MLKSKNTTIVQRGEIDDKISSSSKKNDKKSENSSNKLQKKNTFGKNARMRKFKMKSSKNYAEDSIEDSHTHKTNNDDVSLETVF